MVALEANITPSAWCLVDLHNQARKAKANRYNEIVLVLAELVLCITEVHHHDVKRAAVFKLSDLARLYTIRLEQLGIKLHI